MNKWSRKNEGAQPMMVAADSLVHFMNGGSRMFRETADDDGVTAMEVARTAYLCMNNL
ncbi:MAG: hypothetical protein K6A68_08945 [Clostridiales bacterium]|nr:hypothetical protein [Clostridiales bacterium]